MLAQNRMLRRHALGTLPRRCSATVTRDPAMQLFLSLADSTKDAPNENYARELMELFTLGTGYTERDVREAARALTGFRADWHDDGLVAIALRPRASTTTASSASRQARAARRRRRARHRLAHPHHAPFLVGKLWELLRRDAAEPRDRARARARPTARSGLRDQAGRARDPGAPGALPRTSTRPTWSSRPVVYVAGALRTTGSASSASYRTWLLDDDGPVPVPPAVRRRLGLGPGVDVDGAPLRDRREPARPHRPRARGDDGRA